MPKTLSLLAVLKKVDAKGVKSLSDAQWNTFLASDTEPNEIGEKIKKLEGYEEKGANYDATGELIVEDNQAMIDRFKERTGRGAGRESLKVKKSKIDVKSFKEDFLNKKEEPIKADTTGTSSLVPFKPPAPNTLPEGEEKKEETEGLKGIRDVLDDILKVLRLDFKDDRKEARDAQKEAARKKRGEREDKLEGVGKAASGIGKAIQAMVKPFSSIWDIIMNFVKTVILGVLLNKILKWFGNPENQEKIKSLGKFFRDWWPALTTAALLFLTPLGGLVKGVVGLLTAIIPKLVMAIAANPWAAALMGTGLAIWGVSKLAGGGKKKEKQEKMEIPEADEEVEMSGGGMVPHVVDAQTSAQNFIQKYNQGGTVMDDQIQNQEQFNVLNPFNIIKLLGAMNQADEGEGEFGGGFTGRMMERRRTLGESVQGFSKGGKVPGSGNKDTVPAMLTPGEFVMSKGAVNKYGTDTLENMNAAAGASGRDGASGATGGAGPAGAAGKEGTVPAMLTPGEFVVSAPAVQEYGTNTLESMNAMGGGTNKPEFKEPNVEVNNGGLINNYRNMQSNHYSTGGVVKYFQSGGLVQYLQGGGEVDKPQGMMRWLAGAADVMTGGLTDFDKRGSMVDGAKRIAEKIPPGTPVQKGENKIVTLPPISKQNQSQTRSNSDVPQFRINIESSQRSMVISSLGLADLMGG